MKKFTLILLCILNVFVYSILFSQVKRSPVFQPWPGGYIPYTVRGYFSVQDFVALTLAMKEWEDACNVTFIYVPFVVNSNIYYIERKSVDYCSSTVGYNPNLKKVMIVSNEKWATNHGILLHELGHCLGFIHEHQRPDRDSFITINWDNIRRDCEPQIRKLDDIYFIYPTNELQFDYCSIMLYHEYAKAIDKKVKTLDMGGKYGRIEKLSKLDTLKAQYVYGKPKGKE